MNFSHSMQNIKARVFLWFLFSYNTGCYLIISSSIIISSIIMSTNYITLLHSLPCLLHPLYRHTWGRGTERVGLNSIMEILLVSSPLPAFRVASPSSVMSPCAYRPVQGIWLADIVSLCFHALSMRECLRGSSNSSDKVTIYIIYIQDNIAIRWFNASIVIT